MNVNEAKAIVFDLDGTLIDTAPDLRAMLNQVLVGMGRRELALEEVRCMIGDGTPAMMERALAATGGITDFDRAHRKLMQIYEAGPANLSRLYPGVETTLRSLRDSGANLGICTNKPQVATLSVLEAFNIAHYFEAVAGGDTVPFRKPDPRHLLGVIQCLKATISEAVMIGDSENDYAAARSAGVPVILLRYGYLRVPPERLTPDIWLDDFAAIPWALARLVSSDGGTTRSTDAPRPGQ
jgi:phosphoglycolate phosphatase